MIGLRWITKRELLLWDAMLKGLRKDNEDLRRQLAEKDLFWSGRVEHERRRAEGAINILLAKTQGMAIKNEAPSESEIAAMEEKMMGLFGRDEADAERQAREIEAIQS